ncbi:putative Transcription factor domain-containing protein [Seiridium cardinale]
MRCRPGIDGSKCERCIRKSLDCIFQDHRRGRKPGTKIAQRTSISLTPVPPTPAPEQSRSTNSVTATTPQTRVVENGADWETGTLQPSGLLHHAVKEGKFSLRNILSPAEPGAFDVSNESSPQSLPPKDPVLLGHVHLSIAKSLYENFMEVLNPYISQLDPALHTFDTVRQRSSFLFTTILAAAAKSFNPALYSGLHDYAESLLAEAFRRGSKSTEIAQAVLILTYWKEPEDTRAWIFLGYVIRMGMDLGWHRLAPYSAQDQTLSTEMQKREVRNVQRTWYLLFVYDRSISLQTGKPWMIERSACIESIEAWCRDPMATGNDRLLGAFVTLRLLSSEVFKLLGPKSSRIHSGPLHSIESLLAIIKARIEEWEQIWVHYVDAESCHPFLIRFYGTHLKLQLFSLPLQEVLASEDPNISTNLEVLWVSYSSAIEMLQLICRSTPYLYFAQDSIHVMTAYSATFLIKLLLSTPESIANQIEPEVTRVISSAARVFSQQASPPGSSCTLQAKFLEKIISDYMERRREQRAQAPRQHATNDANVPRPRSVSDTSKEPREARGYNRGMVNLESIHSLANSGSHQARLDFSFAEDDTWADMFANAGFNIQEGVFFA